MRYFSAVVVMSISSLAAVPAWAKPTIYTCKLNAVIASSAPKSVQQAPKTLELKYSLDNTDNKAFLIDKTGQKSVSVVKAKDSLTFTDITRDGSVTTTQIQKNGDTIFGPLTLSSSKKPDLHYLGPCKKS
jgi:hypothetical protein